MKKLHVRCIQSLLVNFFQLKSLTSFNVFVQIVAPFLGFITNLVLRNLCGNLLCITATRKRMTHRAQLRR